MSVVFAVFTSHPPLLSCELERAASAVHLRLPDTHTDASAGWYHQDTVLLRRFSHDHPPDSPRELAPGELGSEGILYHSGPVPADLPLEDNAQPFRALGWLFTQVGPSLELARIQTRLLGAEPTFDARMLAGQTAAEAAFQLFLKRVREVSRSSGLELGARPVGQALGRVARVMEEAGVKQGSWVAMHRQMLVAARMSGPPLHYALLEGTEHCERCGHEDHPDQERWRRMHRARRTVLVASHPKDGGFVELPPRHVLSVDARLNVMTAEL